MLDVLELEETTSPQAALIQRKVPLTNLHGSKLWRGSTCVIHGMLVMLVCCVMLCDRSAAFEASAS